MFWLILLVTGNVRLGGSLLCRTSHVDSRCGGVGSFCNGEIYPDPSAIQFHTIGMFLCLNGNRILITPNDSPIKKSENFFCSNLLWVLAVFKVDEGKASWPPRLLVIDNVDIAQRAIFGENISEIPLSGVQTQSKHTQTVIGVRVCLRTTIITRGNKM